MEAPAGTKISHGTPAARAAKATAWAWLPALPATTPTRARSPRSASLARAPRILNEPVRWRFSAFSTTSPPQRSDSHVDVTTGVALTIPAPAAAARAMSASDGSSGGGGVVTAPASQSVRPCPVAAPRRAGSGLTRL